MRYLVRYTGSGMESVKECKVQFPLIDVCIVFTGVLNEHVDDFHNDLRFRN
jgi:hypothetical protein